MRAWVVRGLALGAVLFAAVVVLRGRPARTGEQETPAPPPAEAVRLPAARFAALQQAPRPRLAPPVGEKPVSEACLALWDALRGLDTATALADSAKAAALPRGAGCARLPGGLDRFHHKFLADCGPFFEAREKLSHEAYAESAPGCHASLQLYRAHLTDWLTRDLRPQDIVDMKVLADKLLARFDSDPATAAALAERMLELDPSLTPAAKASMMSRFFDAQMTAAGKPDDGRWRRAEDAAQRLSMMEGAPKNDVVEMGLMGTLMRYGGDGDRLFQGGEEAARRHPELATGPYYAAWGEFKRGNRTAALEWLAEARRRAPNDARLLEAEAKLRRGEADPFRAVLSYTIDPG